MLFRDVIFTLPEILHSLTGTLSLQPILLSVTTRGNKLILFGALCVSGTVKAESTLLGFRTSQVIVIVSIGCSVTAPTQFYLIIAMDVLKPTGINLYYDSHRCAHSRITFVSASTGAFSLNHIEGKTKNVIIKPLSAKGL